MVDKVTKELMDNCNISVDDIERLKNAAVEWFDRFEKGSREDKLATFFELTTASASMHKLRQVMLDAGREKVSKLIMDDESGLMGQFISILSCYVMIGANLGFMKSAEDDK